MVSELLMDVCRCTLRSILHDVLNMISTVYKRNFDSFPDGKVFHISAHGCQGMKEEIA